MNKLEQLYMLASTVSDFIDSADKTEACIKEQHFSLFAGNPDAKIAVVQFKPDTTELYWAKKHLTHEGMVLHNPSGTVFERTATRAGFDMKKDFFFCNYFPFATKADVNPPRDILVKDYAWIYECMMEIVQPDLVMTLGVETFNCLTHYNTNVLRFKEMLNRGDILESPQWPYKVLPLEDMKKVEAENQRKNKGFFAVIKRLYTQTHKLKNKVPNG